MSDTVKMILVALLVCVALLGIKKVMDWRDAALRSEQQTRTMETTSGIVKDGNIASVQRNHVASNVAQAKERFDNQIAEDRKNEPEIADRADRSVPASRLRAFRERRLARERSGCAGEQCSSGSTSSDSTEW